MPPACLGKIVSVAAAAMALGGVALTAARARADEFHYKNVLVGERASGLGGAYAAISDDPSGIFYNPAGLSFSMENYISISANAYSSTTQRFKNVVAGQDYELKSQGLIPVFFGFSQNLGKSKIGFAVVVPNAELFDQDDRIEGISTTAKDPNELRRRFFLQDTTYLAGPALSREVFKNFSLGVSLMGFARLYKAIDNQFMIYNPVPSGVYYTQNTYITQFLAGLYPKAGLQFMPLPKWSVGFTASRMLTLRGRWKIKQLRTALDDAGDPVTSNGEYSHDLVSTEVASDYAQTPDPLSFSLGNAYFFSKRFLLAADLDYHLALPSFTAFPLDNAFNWALGAEWYATETLPLRLGVFSNNANTPALASGATDQNPHVNLIGLSAAVSFLQPGSSFTLGGTYSAGSGEAQIISGRTAIQTLQQRNITGYITGSYQL